MVENVKQKEHVCEDCGTQMANARESFTGLCPHCWERLVTYQFDEDEDYD